MSDKRHIFISDLHLDQQTPAIAQHLFDLLNKLQSNQDELYILGDLFEHWVGDDDSNEFENNIKNKLRETVDRGIPIYILHGNRDFFLGKQFFSETKCQLLEDETKINIFNTDVLLMHGDTLCVQDKNYQRFRRFVRHPVTKFLYYSLPLSIRRFIVNTARKKSQQHTQRKSLMKMDVVESAVTHTMQKHNVKYLIHGHTHQPNIHTHSLTNGNGTRIVLEAWHPIGAAYIWEAAQQVMSHV